MAGRKGRKGNFDRSGCTIPKFQFTSASESSDYVDPFGAGGVGKDSWAAVKKKFVSAELNEKFSVVYNDLKSRDDLPELERDQSTKSTIVSEFRELGNWFFSKKNYAAALKQYIRCVSIAPLGSEELAIAYANRSAALIQLKRYEACLVDVNRAISENYPKEKIAKLFSRKKKCVEILQRDFQNLNTQEIDATNDETYKEYLMHKSKEYVVDEDATDMNYEEKFYLPEVHFKNTYVPFASEKVKIQYSSNRHVGRQVLAVQKIQPGEVLSFEEPYASVLLYAHLLSHCSNCHVRCEAMIPCNTCSLAMYCSKKCRDDALNRYHRSECRILWDVKHLTIPPNVWLAVRVFLIATKQGQDLEMLMKHPIFKDPFKVNHSESSKIFNSSDYHHIHNLEFNLEKQTPEALHNNCFLASIFLHMLKMFGFFGPSCDQNLPESASLSEKELFAGNLLLKIILSLECNIQGIMEYSKNTKSISPNASLDIKNIGWGLYSFHSAFNHSCDGNATFYFHKNTIVCGSNRSIKSGQQICVSYAGHYYDVPRKERQALLSGRYLFDCCCEACTKNWPLLKSLPDYNPNKGDQSRQMGFLLRFRMMPEAPTLDKPFNASTLAFYRELIEILEDNAGKLTSEFVQHQCAVEQIFSSRGTFYDLPRDKVLLDLDYF